MPEDSWAIFNETPKHLTCSTTIAPITEPGERIRITGTVYESDGKTPAKNVILYFYHTNDKGIYAKRGNEPRSSMGWWHGYNRGWFKTNEKGRYIINSIKPKPYPSATEPEHIHVVVKAPAQREPYDLGAITFKGDPLATEHYWYQVEQHGHPRDGGTVLRKNSHILEGRRDFTLYTQYDTAADRSGLLQGEQCPTFTPVHLTGRDSGTKVCPMCKYGYRKGLMAWVNHDYWEEVRKTAMRLDKEAIDSGVNQFSSFLIYMNPRNLSIKEIEKRIISVIEKMKTRNVAMLTIPPGDADRVFAMYRLNRYPQIECTFLYFNRRLVTKNEVIYRTDVND